MALGPEPLKKKKTSGKRSGLADSGEAIRARGGDQLPPAAVRIGLHRRTRQVGGNLLHAHCACFFSSRRRHTRLQGDWSSDVCSSDLLIEERKRSTQFRFVTGAYS